MASNHPIGLSMPPISEDVYRKLHAAFTPLVPTPNSHTIEDVMYSAGQMDVVRWLEQFRQKSIVTGG